MSLASIIAASPALCRGQEDAEPGIGLQEVLEITMDAGTGIRLAIHQAARSRGDLLLAQGIYDGLLTVFSNQSRLDDPAIGAPGINTTDLTVAWRQRLRSGLTITPSTFVSRTALDGASSEATNSGGIDLTVEVPLLEDRGGIIGRLNEQAATTANEADLADLLHERSATLLQSANAYWRYVAARRRLDVSVLSERRAGLLAEETGALVEAEERPSADLNQVDANLAIKRIGRVDAEQRLHEARRALGVAMGLPATDVLAIPAPIDTFPSAVPFALDPDRSDRLVDLARSNRADLAASTKLVASALLALEADENGLKPRLDLTASGGYRGFDQGSDASAFFAALFDDIPGLSASLGVRYQLPHKNTSDRGRAVRSRALYDQQRVLLEDLDRRIVSAVRVAALALVNSLEQASYIEAAVSSSRATVDNEKEKYGLGLATLFDVIQAEDNLTAALLSEIDIRLAYALALGGLRFETGTLLAPGTGTASVDARRFTTPPPG